LCNYAVAPRPLAGALDELVDRWILLDFADFFRDHSADLISLREAIARSRRRGGFCDLST